MVGKHPAKLDDKGRLIVPAKLRAELGDNFFVTLGLNCGHRCLTVYTKARWDTLVATYDELPISQKGAATSLIFINATECTPDKQFRFMVTQNLLDYAGISRDVIIAGRGGQAEIWDAEEFKRFELENLTPEKLMASLEAIGL